jgi:hypothetical protein
LVSAQTQHETQREEPKQAHEVLGVRLAEDPELYTGGIIAMRERSAVSVTLSAEQISLRRRHQRE